MDVEELGAPLPVEERKNIRGWLGAVFLRRPPTILSSTAALALLYLAFGLLNARFFTGSNLENIAVQSSIPLIAGIGATFVILAGGIDLSTEGVMALTGVVLSLLVANGTNDNDFGLLAIAIALTVGAGVGLINGFAHSYLKLPSFIMTLGTWFIGVGVAVVLYRGFPVQITDATVRGLAAADLDFGVVQIPVLCLIAAGVLVLALILERHTRFGTYVYAIGGNESLARLSGIPVNRYKLFVFTLAGILFGLAGVLNASRLGVGTGEVGSFLFPSLTAVVVGGTALSGGEGSVLNTLVGSLIVAVIANGLILAEVTPNLQSGVQGLLILIAVGLTLNRGRLGFVK